MTIHSNNTASASCRRGGTWRRALTLTCPLMAMMICASLTGCAHRGVTVLRSDEMVTRVKEGQQITAPMNGWFMSDALYLRYREAVADRILEIQNP